MSYFKLSKGLCAISTKFEHGFGGSHLRKKEKPIALAGVNFV